MKHKTTINLDVITRRNAKEFASNKGMTLGGVIYIALIQFLEREQANG